MRDKNHTVRAGVRGDVEVGRAGLMVQADANNELVCQWILHVIRKCNFSVLKERSDREYPSQISMGCKEFLSRRNIFCNNVLVKVHTRLPERMKLAGRNCRTFSAETVADLASALGNSAGRQEPNRALRFLLPHRSSTD